MKIEIYKDKKGLWRWRFRSTNGNILADSGQGYRGSRSTIMKRVNKLVVDIRECCLEIVDLESGETLPLKPLAAKTFTF